MWNTIWLFFDSLLWPEKYYEEDEVKCPTCPNAPKPRDIVKEGNVYRFS